MISTDEYLICTWPLLQKLWSTGWNDLSRRMNLMLHRTMRRHSTTELCPTPGLLETNVKTNHVKTRTTGICFTCTLKTDF